MRILFQILCPLVFVATCLPVYAQSSFLGIPLDSIFPGEVKECPKMSGLNIVDTARLDDVGTCFLEKSANRYEMHNTADLGIGYTLEIETYKDKPLVFRMRFSKAMYSQAVDIFTARYGRPQRAYRETVRTGAGASYPSRTAIWDSGKLHVQLDEIGADVRWSDGAIFNAELLKEKSSKNAAAAKAAADRL